MDRGKYNAIVLGVVSVFSVAFAPWIVAIFTSRSRRRIGRLRDGCCGSWHGIVFSLRAVFTQWFKRSGDTWMRTTWINRLLLALQIRRRGC